MLAVRTILHATDFSERSEYALGLACALARDYVARLIVLHVAEAPTLAYGEGAIPPTLDELRASAQEQLNLLRLPLANVRAERRLEEGDVVPEILRVARDTNTDLIVLGTHGRTGLARLLMGSVAEEVVRKALCPVLTVKSPFPETAREPELAEAAAPA
jgi:nucleotide-binding universal stress UspA family protein